MVETGDLHTTHSVQNSNACLPKAELVFQLFWFALQCPTSASMSTKQDFVFIHSVRLLPQMPR